MLVYPTANSLLVSDNEVGRRRTWVAELLLTWLRASRCLAIFLRPCVVETLKFQAKSLATAGP